VQGSRVSATIGGAMKQVTIDEQVDAAIARQDNDPVFIPAPSVPAWLAPFEQNLPFRLPPTYRSLLLRYRFPPFVVGTVELYGNVDGDSYDDLVVASIRDEVLSSVGRANGFIQIGRPESGSYDPICFDMRRRAKSGEAALVRLDHEEILCNDSIRVLETVAGSFLELLARGIHFRPE
jgi:hypothetical protein